MINILGSIVNPNINEVHINLEFINVVRYMDLLQSLFLFGHLHLSRKW